MTPAARVAAAIEVLDQVLSGEPAEKTLTTWARTHRFAGSKDRAAIRDHVFDALRRRRSYAALGGGDDGRALMLGAVRARKDDPDATFSGEGHAPGPLTEAERAGGSAPSSGAEALDCPDWLWPRLQADLGDAAEAVLSVQQDVAPVGLRANLAKVSRAALQTELAAAGIVSDADDRSPSALVAEGRPRGIQALAAYRDGRLELQDVGSQVVSDMVPLRPGESLLDYCAGGGGKTLAVAARVNGTFVAHDALPQRMAGLPERAARAGVKVRCVRPDDTLPKCDTVLIDVPCSGTGTWRRAPEAKWRLTAEKLDELTRTQSEILDIASALVRPGGHLVYATCSILSAENGASIEAFLNRNAGFDLLDQRRILPDVFSDGYYVATMRASGAVST